MLVTAGYVIFTIQNELNKFVTSIFTLTYNYRNDNRYLSIPDEAISILEKKILCEGFNEKVIASTDSGTEANVPVLDDPYQPVQNDSISKVTDIVSDEQESCNGSNEDKLSAMPELIDDIQNTKSHVAMSNKKKRRVRIAAVFGSGTPEDKKINKTGAVDAEHLTMLQSNQSPVQYKKDTTEDKPYSISTFQTQQNGIEPVQYEKDSTEDKPYSISTFQTQQNGIEPVQYEKDSTDDKPYSISTFQTQQNGTEPVQYEKDSTEDKPYSISTFQTQQNGTEPVQYEKDSTEDKPYSISTFQTQQNGIEPDSSYTSTTNVLWKFSSDQSHHLLNHKQTISAKIPVVQTVRDNSSLRESTAYNHSVEDQILFTQVENRTLES